MRKVLFAVFIAMAALFALAGLPSIGLGLTISGNNVGIGTNAPVQPLDVVGNINSSANITATGSLSAGSASVTGAVSASSFSGNGSGLTNIPGTGITAGTISSNQIAAGAVTPDKVAYLSRVSIVAKSGGAYSDPVSAMAAYSSWCPSPSATNPCLLKIMPGVYTVASPVIMQSYIDIEGSGEDVTMITGAIGNSSLPPSNGVVNGATNAEIRFLTVNNTGDGNYVAAILNNSASPSIMHITASASGTSSTNYGVYNDSNSSPTMTNVTASASGSTISNLGVYNNSNSSPTMSNVTASASGSTTGNYGVLNYGSSPTMTNVTASASGTSSYNFGVYNDSNSSPTMTNVTASASGTSSTSYGVINGRSSSPMMTNVSASASGSSSTNYGVRNDSNASPTMTNVTASASGTSSSNCGVYNTDASPTMTNVTASGKSGIYSYGLYNSSSGSSYMMTADRSTFEGSTNSIFNDIKFTLDIGASKLVGALPNTDGTYNCVGVYKYIGGTLSTADPNCQ